MEAKKREKFIAAVLCFLASFCLWIYVSNSDNVSKTKEITVPVELTHVESMADSKLALLPNQKYTVSIKIKGKAADVNSIKKEQFKIIADLSSFSLKKGVNRVPVEIKSTPVGKNITILNQGLWVKINLDTLIEKSVAVKTKIDVKTRSGYFAGEPVTKPVRVTVSGPFDYVNAVSYVLVKGELKDVDKDIYTNLPVVAVDEGGKTISEVTVNPQSVDVTIPVNKSKQVSVNVSTKGTLPTGLMLKSLTALQSKVYISGDDNALSKVDSISTEPVDLSQVVSSTQIKAKLTLPKDISMADGNNYIDVSIVVDKVIQKTVAVNLELRNLPQNLNAVPEVKTINITVSGLENTINSLKSDDIKAYVDLTGAVEGDKLYNINITLPSAVTQTAVDKQSLKITFTKKQ